MGLAEVRRTGFEATTIDEGHKIWCCGEDSKRQYGVTFIVRKEVVGSIISCTPHLQQTHLHPDFSKTIQRHSHGETNDRGWRLLEFAKSHQLTLANILQPHKWSRTATWYAPNGQVHNQTDFIPTPHCFKSCSTKQTQGLSQVPTLAAMMTPYLQLCD